MEILWNQINLQRPPCRSWEAPLNEFDSRILTDTIERILSDFKTFNVLHKEAALLSRLVYRMKSKFRSDKGVKHMEKVNRALLNYLNMSLEKEYELLKDYIEINSGTVSLPSRQILEYVLVRTQGFAKLMCRVESTASIAANILKGRLHSGQSWAVAMIAYAVISRIWILSRYIIKKSCMWYNNIYSYNKTFKIVSMPWLPSDYILPEDLSEWLNLPWINEDITKLPMKEDWGKTIFNFIKTDDDMEADASIINNLMYSSEKEITKPTIQANKSISTENDNDLGDPISRDNFEEANIKNINKIEKKVKKKIKEKNSKTNKKSKLLNIKSEKDLVRLLKAKSFPGLDKLQWSILQKRIKKLSIKLTKNNTCELGDEEYKKINRHIKKWTN